MPFGNAVVTCYVTSGLNDGFSLILEQTRDTARRDCIPTQRVTAIKLSDIVGRIRRQPSSDITQLKLEPSDLRRMTAKALSPLQDSANP